MFRHRRCPPKAPPFGWSFFTLLLLIKSNNITQTCNSAPGVDVRQASYERYKGAKLTQKGIWRRQFRQVRILGQIANLLANLPDVIPVSRQNLVRVENGAIPLVPRIEKRAWTRLRVALRSAMVLCRRGPGHIRHTYIRMDK
jgi:hypothetical protein